jgi:hypothetical protein
MPGSTVVNRVQPFFLVENFWAKIAKLRCWFFDQWRRIDDQGKSAELGIFG